MYVLGFEGIDRTKLALAGGKGASLGELSRIDGIRVPEGFCVTTLAFEKIVGAELGPLLDALGRLKPEERSSIGASSEKIRALIERTPIPEELAAELAAFLERFGEADAYAVRSSATAEDLPTASFAGQHDTHLNVIGKAAILEHIRKCWASLFTDRAVTYRLQNGFDHRRVQLAVVVQKMVASEVSGVLFTADPISGHRRVSSIDAVLGLGEALVSGRVNADHYRVRDGRVIEKKGQALGDEQLLELERIGRKIEAHFGRPQDIEWCWVKDGFYIVQSRPITTLYPVPEVGDSANHVYVSVGHQQMMTDPMKPLGVSFFQITAGRPMFEAGGRMFVDVAGQLASPATRNVVIGALGRSDPLLKDALLKVTGQGEFVEGPVFRPTQIEADPAVMVDFVRRNQNSVAALKQTIPTKSGPELFDYILEDIAQLRTTLFDPQSLGLIMAAINASAWINEKMAEWLGEKSVADTLAQSVPNNVTSEMGLALLDVADVIRPHPQVIAFLQRIGREQFLADLEPLAGGREAREAFGAFLEKYGMRCVGEIDITRPRWSEKPSTLVPLILGNVKNFEPGAGKRKFEQGQQEASKKEAELLGRLKTLPEGEPKAAETKRMIDLIRNFSGYREYPKYGMVSRYLLYKQALLREADALVRDGVISEREDIYYLGFEELREVVRDRRLDASIIERRKEAYRSYEKLTPPRVMTSDGEIVTGVYAKENLPGGALAGLAVSSGVVEGRARVIADLQAAEMEKEDILVTAFTDPSWTPLFVSIKGLVTEVGGMMTHGAVIAREYGLPAVVGVEHATRLIRDGQRIRVNGTDGYVELL